MSLTTLVRNQTFIDVVSTDPELFTLGATPTAGNVLVLQRAVVSGTATISTVTQTNVTWTRAKRNTVNQDCDIWIGVVGASPGTVITVDLSAASATQGRYNVSEWSGMSTDGGLVAAQCLTANATGTTVSTPTQTFPSASNFVLIACIRASAGYSSGPTNGWSKFENPGTSNGQFIYKIVNAATSGGTETSDVVFASSVANGVAVIMMLASIPAAGAFTMGPPSVAAEATESEPPAESTIGTPAKRRLILNRLWVSGY